MSRNRARLIAGAGLLSGFVPCIGLVNPCIVAQSPALRPTTNNDVRMLLSRLSISPETACASGIGGDEVPSLFEATADTLEALAPSFQANDTALSSARTALTALRNRATSDPNAAIASEIAAAEGALAACFGAQSTLLQTAFDSISANLPEAPRARLAVFRLNAQQPVPLEYKAVERSRADWVSLQAALQHVSSREACGLSPKQDKLALVTAASADTEVGAARQRLATALPAVRATWDAQGQQ